MSGADVGDVGEHPDPVQLPDESLAPPGQPAVLRPVGRGVGPLDVVPVRQRQVPAAQLVEERSAAADCSIMWPPSTPMSEAIRPDR